MHIKRMHEMIEKLTECTKTAMDAGETCVGKYPIGDCVDMIKDLCDAEYHAHIVKAMEEEKEEEKEDEKYMLKRFKEEYGEDDGERKYYDNYRYMRSGRFAPKRRGTYDPRGRSRRMGYMPPMIMDMPWEEEYDPMDDAYIRAGYSDGNRGGNSGRTGGSRSGGNYGGNRSGESSGRGGSNSRSGYEEGERRGSRYGRSYDRYDDARRHYKDTKDMESKKEMEDSMKEHVEDFSDSIKEMWKDAEPQLRQQMKAEMMKIVQQLQ